jgi:AraC family transcriptional regulator, regulatory protein of adaptative response / methylated-DNA-[protein]-cysteine methyltransferase
VWINRRFQILVGRGSRAPATRNDGPENNPDLKARDGVPRRPEGATVPDMVTNSMRSPVEIDRWDAVMRRDRSADGLFFYSVHTTGVYCRPSCPSRRARPEHVRFHASAADAEAAGFRPCKRCRPNEMPLIERQASAIADVCRLIERTDHVPNAGVLAATAGMSRFHFQRVFKTITGLTPRAYAMAHRANRVRKELKRSATITEAIYNAGFNSDGRFYARSSDILGMTPREFRSGAAATSIRFAIGQCSLGTILVAASERGICAILLGDDPEALIRSFQDRFPRASLIGADAGFEAWVARVVGFVDAPRLGLDLPLDIQGTAFQQRVWQALREIPAGSTASYAAIARKLGTPRAARAVAQACAANRLAVAIPCHRVVRADGGLSGYRWGVDRKRALLDREA